jgi:hypothetical protein
VLFMEESLFLLAWHTPRPPLRVFSTAPLGGCSISCLSNNGGREPFSSEPYLNHFYYNSVRDQDMPLSVLPSSHCLLPLLILWKFLEMLSLRPWALESGILGFQSWVCHLLPMSSWANESLDLDFLDVKMDKNSDCLGEGY